jgi:hypothetical protein
MRTLAGGFWSMNGMRNSIFRAGLLGVGVVLALATFAPAAEPSLAAVPVEPAPTYLGSGYWVRGFDYVISVHWTDNAHNEDSYHVERCIGAGCTNFVEWKKTGANVTRVTGYGEFLAGRTWRFRVRAHGPYGFSAYSNISSLKFGMR